MAYIVDIIIGIVLLVSIFFGYRRGLVKTVFGCLSLIAAIILASHFGPFAGGLIKETKLFGDVSENLACEISLYFDKTAKEGIESITSKNLNLDSSPAGDMLLRLGIDSEKLCDGYVKALSKGAENVKEDVIDAVSGPILDCIANAAGTLIVFILSLIALKLLSVIIDRIARLPILKTVNKFGGILAGALSGFVGVFILCTILELLLPCIPENPVIYPGMENDTILYSFFLGLNPVILLIFS